VAAGVAAGAELLINLSASPFTLPKRDERPRMFQAAARRFGVPMLFVNQACGNDDLVFDGHSLAFGPDGIPWARGAEFDTDLVMVDVAAGTGTQRDGQPNDDAAVLAALVLGTRDYIHRCGFSSALVGLSGGIDSSVVAAVAARALGPDNVVGVAMPTRYSSAGSLTDAEALARNLGIHYEVLPIDGLFQGFLDALEPLFDGRAADVTEENIQARVRGVVLMSLSNKFGHMLLTTGNKSEMSVGYATLYGDMAGGLALIADVPKTLVYRVAVEMNRDGEQVPQTVIDKPPSAELRPDQKDSDSLPDYDVLDAILYHHVERGEDREAIVARGFDGDVVEDVMRKVRIAEYKRRQAPPCLKVTSKAFGFGRRMPIAQGWRG
jgi:NAD+ synthetase